jgi:hypothetical protein
MSEEDGKRLLEEDALENPEGVEEDPDAGTLQQMANAIRAKREKFFSSMKKTV